MAVLAYHVQLSNSVLQSKIKNNVLALSNTRVFINQCHTMIYQYVQIKGTSRDEKQFFEASFRLMSQGPPII